MTSQRAPCLGWVDDFAARVHPGLVRRTNEDVARVDEALRLAVVADGLGGHPGGDVASRVAVDTTMRSFGRQGGVGTTATTTRRLLQALEDADFEVRAQPSPTRGRPMGTTLVALALGPTWAAIAHLGDSRCYRFRAGELSCITRDHVLDQAAPPAGRLLTRCIGGGASSTAEIAVTRSIPGDVYLLCSDGLWEAVSEWRLKRICHTTRRASLACEHLVRAACAGGGHDNIGVAVLRVGSPATEAGTS